MNYTHSNYHPNIHVWQLQLPHDDKIDDVADAKTFEIKFSFEIEHARD